MRFVVVICNLETLDSVLADWVDRTWRSYRRQLGHRHRCSEGIDWVEVHVLLELLRILEVRVLSLHWRKHALSHGWLHSGHTHRVHALVHGHGVHGVVWRHSCVGVHADWVVWMDRCVIALNEWLFHLPPPLSGILLFFGLVLGVFSLAVFLLYLDPSLARVERLLLSSELLLVLILFFGHLVLLSLLSLHFHDVIDQETDHTNES